MLSKFQTTQCEINTQFEVCYCNDLTLTADKHLLNNESEMCVGPTADSPLSPKQPTNQPTNPVTPFIWSTVDTFVNDKKYVSPTREGLHGEIIQEL